MASGAADDKTARVGQHLAPGRGLETAAIGVGDARISRQSRRLGAPRPLDALLAVQRVDIFIKKMQIAGKRTELCRFGQAGKGILFRDLGQRQRALDELTNAVGGQVTRRRRSRPRSQKDAQTKTA